MRPTGVNCCSGSFFAITLVSCVLVADFALAYALDQRSVETVGYDANAVPVVAAAGSADYPEQYEQYQKPMPKRAALLLDRLLVALQKAVDNDEMAKDGYKTYVRSLPNYSDVLPDMHGMQLADERTMDLQRRGQAKGRVYWRCYLNAVTCFKRK